MTQGLQSSPAIEPPSRVRSPRVWGLTPRQLHDAFWNARGVQCVRRGVTEPLQDGAEQYLLIEADQIVLFDLRELSDRLTWHDAAVTRLRLIDRAENTYSEHVVIDDDAFVQRIERRYSAPMQASCRVVLTPHQRIARLWMVAETRRRGWDRVRRSVAWSRVDHLKCEGRAFRDGEPADEVALLRQLVEVWPNPAQAIDGVRESAPGVWSPVGCDLDPDVVRIGPYWIGLTDAGTSPRCMVGPAWAPDAPGAVEHPERRAVVRPIDEIEMAEQARPTSAASHRIVYSVIKRGLDILGSAAALVLAAPVMAVIAVMIWLEDGRPIFFGHQRQGRNGRLFRCWKFRTMHPDSERIARELEDYNICDGPQVFIQDDPRVTKSGRVLRQLHLDETPQFWNVLIGHMSLVGPRPSPDKENQYCPAWREQRLSVRPGITGLWQLKRTREPGEDFQEWIKYDMEYVRRASLWLDLKILAKTAWAVAFGRNDRASE